MINATTLANGTDIILDASNKAISINDATFGNTGIQLQYNSGTPRAHIGTTTNYWQFDGTKVKATAAAGSSNMEVTGGVIHGTFNLAGPNDQAGGGTPQVMYITTGSATASNDYIYLGLDDSTGDGNISRYNRTKANATFRDLAFVDVNAGTGNGVYGAAYDGTNVVVVEAANIALRHYANDYTGVQTTNTAFNPLAGVGIGTHDGTYFCFLTTATNVQRMTFGGAPFDYTVNDNITLSNGITGALCWNPSNSQWYGYDSANNLLRSFNSTGTQQATLSIYEDVVDIIMLEGKLFVCYISVPEERAAATTGWVVQCVPFDF